MIFIYIFTRVVWTVRQKWKVLYFTELPIFNFRRSLLLDACTSSNVHPVCGSVSTNRIGPIFKIGMRFNKIHTWINSCLSSILSYRKLYPRELNLQSKWDFERVGTLAPFISPPQPHRIRADTLSWLKRNILRTNRNFVLKLTIRNM